MPQMTHSDLPDVVIDVDEFRARNRRVAGWVDVDGDDVSCDECDFVSKSAGGLSSHQRTHTDDD